MLILPPDEAPEAPTSSGFQDFMGYNAMLKQQASEIDIMGVPVTVVLPLQRNMEGYEDVLNSKKPNYRYISPVKAFVDLQPRRSVFYKFNWFPEDQDELTAITFHPAVEVFADSFVRTTVAGNPSPYGDLLFKIVRVFDTGKYKVLSRVCFGKPMVDQQVWKMLFPEERPV